MANIIVVDDDINVLKQVIFILDSLGDQIESLAEPKFLFQMLEETPADLILMDINMPDIDGISLLKQLKDHHVFHSIPVIMLTADDDPNTLGNCFELGAIDFISKPIHETILRARTQAVIKHLQLESQLRQAVKMQAVGTLAGGIAHEFNNLLGVIMGCTGMARDDVPSDSFAKTQLDNVMTASYRVKDLVEQILAFSHQDQQKRISVNLSSVVKESLKLIQSSIPSSVEVKENINPSCGNAHVDPTEIQQIIMNLTSNAVWAMKENGTIEISMNQVNLTAKEASSLSLKEDSYIKLTYSDNGQGMDNKTKSRIFDPFYTEKEVGEGTGMGLSIIYAIMESYKGIISVESASGEGTIFHLYFPVSEKSAIEKTEHIEEIPKGRERILLVDDEEIYAEMVQEMVGRLGYDVDLRMDSREALNVFKTDPENYDLIITDQVMPGLSGEKLVQEIRKIKPDIPIILCTGYSSQMDDEKARILGIDKFAIKPIEKKDISILIRKVLDNN